MTAEAAPRQDAAQQQQQQAAEAEERRRVEVIILLGVLAAAGLFLGPAAAEVRGKAPAAAALALGLNGTQVFWLEAPPGHLTYFEVPVCNLANYSVAVLARVVEVPREVRVFAVYVNGSYFGVRWGNWSEWRGVLPPGLCFKARVEVLVDAQTPPGRTLLVAAVVNSTRLR
ncbi:hypothetical protein [Pyrobaculum sp.]|uniref:hypothetical protein n=1 Tax=Pyrobaculum sp. TaxID=2004705 RepID=UPI0031686EC2